MTNSKDIIRAFEWKAGSFYGCQGQHGLFNSDAIAMANQLEGHTPFILRVNDTRYLGYKRHASGVIPALSLSDEAVISSNVPALKSALHSLGIKSLSLNTLNASSNPDSLAVALKHSGKVRFEFVLDIKQYAPSRISSNHRRNIKKSIKAGASVVFPRDIQAMCDHIQIVNSNLDDKGVGGITNSREYFHFLVQENAGILVQLREDEKVVASTFLIANQDYAYYHSSGASQRGRQIGAAHYLVDRAIARLLDCGMSYLNLGGCTSDQKGLHRFKQGFRPEVHVLASASHRLSLSAKQRILSIFSLGRQNSSSISRVRIYEKRVTTEKTRDLDEFKLQKLSWNSLVDEAAAMPELSKGLEYMCRQSVYCFALRNKLWQIVAVGFIHEHASGIERFVGLRSNSDMACISKVQVVESADNDEIGTLFLVLLEQEAASQGVNRLLGRPSAKDLAAQKLLVTAGYKFLGEEKLPTGELR